MRRSSFRRFSFLFLTLLIVVVFSLSTGGEPLHFESVFFDPTSIDSRIFWDLRLSRVLFATLVGIALSISGVAYQSLLGNPLADPYILGVSGGAALGSVLAMGLDLGYSWISGFSFFFGMATLFGVYRLARSSGRLHPYTLLLIGAILNMITFALILLFNALFAFQDLNRIWFFMVGSLDGIGYSRLGILAFWVVGGFFFLMKYATPMNLIPLGSASAQMLGLDVERTRRRILFSASILVGATVSLSGLVGFVGLAVPHIARLFVGADHRKLLPASALTGASFLVFSDWVARSALSGGALKTEIPVGVVTALIGGPIFFLLLKGKAPK